MKDLLDARDYRVGLIEALLAPGKVVISLRINFPGAKKLNESTRTVARILHNEVQQIIEGHSYQYYESYEGPIYIYVVESTSPFSLKEKMVALEEEHPLGRLADIDVYHDSIKSISRKDLNLKERKCYLCEESAFSCIVQKRHPENEVIAYFNNRLLEFQEVPLNLTEYATRAMLYEVSLEPSFGKVTPSSQGSHQDMDYFLFLDSITVLSKYMYKFALLGYQSKSIEKLYDEALDIGKACESAMFERTKGVNTQKGLIFILGLLVLCSAKVIFENKPFETIFKYIKLIAKRKFKELEDKTLSQTSGERIYHELKIGGVREEARLGFPIIQEALRYLKLDDKASFLKTFLYIMSKCDDTTIIKRKGLEGLDYVKNTASKLMKGARDMNEINQASLEFIEQGINPGGSCDLFSGTVFIKLVKNYFDNKRRVLL